jgi:ABC-type uncharacterized transport system permease subunit
MLKNMDFTIDDVIKAISSLKSGKSAGIDNLIPGTFIECKTILAPILCCLIIFSIEMNILNRGVVVLLYQCPRMGNLNDVNNYKGINLFSIFLNFSQYC